MSCLKGMVLAGCLAACPLVAYLLSAGPATYIMNRGVVSSKAFGALDIVYRPAGLLAKSLKPYLDYLTWCGGKGVDAYLARKGANRPAPQPTEAMVQELRWVQVGMSASEAKRIMEQRGFSCSVVTNGTFGSLRGIDYVYCDRCEGSLNQRRWQTALVLVEGRVSAVRVTTGSVAP